MSDRPSRRSPCARPRGGRGRARRGGAAPGRRDRGAAAADLRDPPHRRRDRRRRQARRGALAAGGRRSTLDYETSPAREHAAAGRRPSSGHLRRPQPLRRLPGARPRAGGDPRPPDRPRPRLPGRLRRRRARHLQRRAPRLRVLRQPARRADGPVPERRHRQRGRVLGRHLGLGRPHHRDRLRGRDRRSPSSSLRFPRAGGAQTWGIDALRIYPRDQRRRIGLTPLDRAARTATSARRSKLTGFEGDHAGPQRRARPHADRQPHRRRATSFPDGALGEGDDDSEPGLTAALGDDAEPDPQRRRQPRLLAGRGRRGAARRQHPVRPLLPREAAVLPRGRRLLRDPHPGRLHPQHRRPRLGRQADRQGGRARAFGVFVAAGRAAPTCSSRRARVLALDLLDEENTSPCCATAATSAGARRSASSHRPRGRRLPQPRRRHRRALSAGARPTPSASRCWARSTDYPAALAAGHRAAARASFDGLRVRARLPAPDARQHGLQPLPGRGADFRADLGFIPQVDYPPRARHLRRYLYDDGEHWCTRFTGAAGDPPATEDQRGQPACSARCRASGLVQRPACSRSSQIDLGLGDGFFAGQILRRELRRRSSASSARRARSTSTSTSAVGDEIDFANTRQRRVVRLRPRPCGSTSAATCASSSRTTTRRSTSTAASSSRPTSRSSAPPTSSTSAPSCALITQYQRRRARRRSSTPSRSTPRVARPVQPAPLLLQAQPADGALPRLLRQPFRDPRGRPDADRPHSSSRSATRRSSDPSKR